MGKLILVRHGQSVWNLQNRFTGWVDVSLSKNGVREAEKAGELLKDFKFDIAFTSNLIRAQETLFAILNLNNYSSNFLRVHQSKPEWYNEYSKSKEDKKEIVMYLSEKLNERYYGKLQGLNKEETMKKYGEEQVKIWRRSFDIAPPEGESLKDTAKRTLPYFKKNIVPYLKQGKSVIVSAHGNSLRSIVMYIENMSPEQIIEFEMKTGVPHIYEFDSKMNLKSRKILN